MAFFWGISYLASSIALRSLNTIQLLSARWTVAAITIVIFILTGYLKFNLKSKPVLAVIAASIINPCVYAILEINGLKLTSVSDAAILIATLPIFVAILQIIFLKDKLTKSVVFSAIICFAGVIFTVVFEEGFSFNASILGYTFLLFATICGAIYTIAARVFSGRIEPIEISAIMAFTGSIFFNLILLFQGDNFSFYIDMFSNFNTIFSVVFLGTMCSVVCFILYNKVVRYLNPALFSVFEANTATFVGVVAGVLVNNDSFSLYKLFGLFLILVGVSIASIFNK